jgi:D-2-hydroxyacid dehydrogenase (NADP+)
MKLLIVIQHPFALWCAPEWLGPRIHRDFPQIEAEQRNTYKDIAEHIRDVEIFFGWSLRGDQFLAARKLRWIHSTAAAVHHLMSPELRASDVIVTNARSVHGPVVAEHAIALMFALAKRLPVAFRYHQQHVWAQEQIAYQEPHAAELAGSTLGLIGYGAIGSEIAKRALALGMRVLAVRLHSERAIAPETGLSSIDTFGPEGLDEALAQSDFVVLAAPVTEKTYYILNAARLSRMKPHAYIINVSRGPLIEEAALVDALRNRRIGGAALDVFDQEPLPSESALWDLDNVIITPHTAALSDKMWERHYALIAENLRRYLSGQPLLGLVDKRVGY